jgi:hypothetical protein
LALLHFFVRLPVVVGENGNVPKFVAGALAFLVEVSSVLESRGLVAYNVFGLSVEGDVDAFHCQPTTKI